MGKRTAKKDKTCPKTGQLLKKRICSFTKGDKNENSFLKEFTLTDNGTKIGISELPTLKVYPFTLHHSCDGLFHSKVVEIHLC